MDNFFKCFILGYVYFAERNLKAHHPCYEEGLEKIPISQGLITLLHICGVTTFTNTVIANTSLETLHQYRRINVALIGECFMMFSKCFMMFYECFTMLNNVLRCLVSHSTIGIGACTVSNHCIGTTRLPITAGICDNPAGIGNNSRKVIPC